MKLFPRSDVKSSKHVDNNKLIYLKLCFVANECKNGGVMKMCRNCVFKCLCPPKYGGPLCEGKWVYSSIVWKQKCIWGFYGHLTTLFSSNKPNSLENVTKWEILYRKRSSRYVGLCYDFLKMRPSRFVDFSNDSEAT